MAARKINRWSARVNQTSNALDLETGVFAKDDPRSIARSLKRSADASRRRKTDSFRSAMSMLNFYINRAGKNSRHNAASDCKLQKTSCAIYTNASKRSTSIQL